jgi:hypothetical protein
MGCKAPHKIGSAHKAGVPWQIRLVLAKDRLIRNFAAMRLFFFEMLDRLRFAFITDVGTFHGCSEHLGTNTRCKTHGPLD